MDFQAADCGWPEGTFALFREEFVESGNFAFEFALFEHRPTEFVAAFYEHERCSPPEAEEKPRKRAKGRGARALHRLTPA